MRLRLRSSCHRPRRRTALYALLAGALALAGCSDIFGGGEAVPVEEVMVEDDEGNSFVIAGPVGNHKLLIGKGQTQHVTFHLNNRNGVRVTDPEAYSVNVVRINNPALFTWRSESARSGTFTGVAAGFTTFRLEVSRNGSVVFTSNRIDLYVS